MIPPTKDDVSRRHPLACVSLGGASEILGESFNGEYMDAWESTWHGGLTSLAKLVSFKVTFPETKHQSIYSD